MPPPWPPPSLPLTAASCVVVPGLPPPWVLLLPRSEAFFIFIHL
uniref:Uncharacterized protein n=1 Tax=Lotus japonicus TaxID=34305 RepID=I3SZR8_LOTJA|nr:unknown [Lotus japonicus]